LRAAAEHDLVEAWRALSSGRADPAAGVEEHDGLVLTSTGLGVALFNGAFVAGACPPALAIELARRFFTARARPYTLRFPPERADLAEAAGAAGMRALPSLGLMALRIPGALPPPAGELAVTRADSVDALGVHAAVLAASFELPVEIMTGFLGDAPLRDVRWAAFNGALDGGPVGVSAVFHSADVAGIYNVATVPAWRGRGVGEAMTWHAVRAGHAAGAQAAVLQPSTMGRPLYERMGFALVAEWRQFSDDPRSRGEGGPVTPPA
jgi:GNAT superfamily N-acetyltransferase